MNLKATGISYRYASTEVLHNISFEVKKGHILGIIGPNGSGKSTLLELLSSFRLLQKGDVTSDGKDITLCRKDIGVVFQREELEDDIKVYDTLDLFGRFYGLSKDGRRKAIEKAISGIGLKADQMVGTLSGGQKRRLELARATLHSPSLLILDEPTSGLDPTAKKAFWKMLLAQRGITIIVASHDLKEVEDLATDILVMHQGRNVLCTDKKRALDDCGIVVRSKEMINTGKKAIKTDDGFVYYNVDRRTASKTHATVKKADLFDVYEKATGVKFE